MRRFFMKTLATLLMSVPLLAAAACAPTSGKDEDKEQKECIQPEGYVLLTSGDATGVQSDGVGVESVSYTHLCGRRRRSCPCAASR